MKEDVEATKQANQLFLSGDFISLPFLYLILVGTVERLGKATRI